jgi:hypothetical protein
MRERRPACRPTRWHKDADALAEPAPGTGGDQALPGAPRTASVHTHSNARRPGATPGRHGACGKGPGTRAPHRHHRPLRRPLPSGPSHRAVPAPDRAVPDRPGADTGRARTTLADPPHRGSNSGSNSGAATPPASPPTHPEQPGSRRRDTPRRRGRHHQRHVAGAPPHAPHPSDPTRRDEVRDTTASPGRVRPERQKRDPRTAHRAGLEQRTGDLPASRSGPRELSDGSTAPDGGDARATATRHSARTQSPHHIYR